MPGNFDCSICLMSSVSSAHSLLFCWLLTHGHVVDGEPHRGSSSPSPSRQEHSSTGPGCHKKFTREKWECEPHKRPQHLSQQSSPWSLQRLNPALQHFMGSSCQELLTDTCLSLHTRKSQFPTGNDSFGADSTPALHQSTPCPRSRAITAWETSATPSPAYCAPSSQRKMHLCVQLFCSTHNELSPD